MRVNCYAVSQHRQKGGESGTDSQATAGKGVGANPCDACASDRGNTQRVPGVKGSLLVEGDGYRVGTLANPLATCIAGANINDHLLLAATLDAVVVERPKPTEGKPQHLCLDKGFDNAPTREVVKERGYEEHIKRIG